MSVKITASGIDTIQPNAVTSEDIADGSIGYEDLAPGTTIQVVSTIYATRTSFTVGTSDTVVPGTTFSITPKLDNSIFKVKYRFVMETNDGWNQSWNIQRNSVRLNSGGNTARYFGNVMPTLTYGGAADNSSTLEMVSIESLDETNGTIAGTPVTYRLTAVSSANRTCYLNSTWSNDDKAGHELGVSEIIIEEIKR